MTQTYQNNSTLIYRRNLTADLSIIRIAPDSGEVPVFEAGQYAEIALPELDDRPLVERRKLIRRAYSIASPPSQRRYLEFFIVRVEGGVITPKVWDLNLGARLWLGPKIKGKFTLAVAASGTQIIMISTGTGLSPFISMVKEHLTDLRYEKFIVIHGTRTFCDLGYREELEDIAKNNDKLIYLPTLTREPESSKWGRNRGRVQTLLEPERFFALTGLNFEPKSFQFFLCGNPQMIDELTPALIAQGCTEHSRTDPGNIHYERFW